MCNNPRAPSRLGDGPNIVRTPVTDLETLRDFCKSLPAVTEGVKWGKDLCFMVAERMFCVTCLEGPFTVSFKVTDDEFDELSGRPGIIPAPYVARYRWVLVENINEVGAMDLRHYVRQSYDLIRAKLPKKVARARGLL